MAAACVVLLLAGRVSVGDAVNAYLVTDLGMVVTFAADRPPPQPEMALADRADGHQRAGLRRPDPAGPGRHGGHRPPSPSVDPPGRLPRR
jgi:hypothetical protein